MKTLNPGTVLKGQLDYKIEKCLGQGGFGITYLATGAVKVGNIKHSLPFTIKEFYMSKSCTRQPNGDVIVHPGSEESVTEHLKEFQHEAERIHKLDDHPGIVKVNEIFNQNKTVYYVMEYLGDTTLESYIKSRGGSLPEDKAVDMFSLVGQALQFLHSKRITHLDVKPANIMIQSSDGEEPMPVLIDFGLAMHYGKKDDPTHENNAICCSDGYSPLEQYLGITKFPEAVLADIYALGATLFYMLAGEKPLVANQMSDAYIDEKLADKVSDNTLAVLKRCMSKLPENRFQTLDEVLKAVNADTTPTDSEDGGEGETRVIGAKAKPIKPKVKPQPQKTKSAKEIGKPSVDPSLLKKIAIGVAAVAVVLGAVIYIMSIEPTPEPDPGIVGDSIETPIIYDLGYATYEGDVKDSIPNGEGTLTYKETCEIFDDNVTKYVASVGDKVSGTFVDGKLKEKTVAKWMKTAGDTVVIDLTPLLDLGYATYDGGIKNNKPNGQGTLTFKKQYEFYSNDQKSYVAAVGDKVSGVFTNGKLKEGTNATWSKQSGESEQIKIEGLIPPPPPPFNLDYAKYDGGLKNGLPNGQGTLTFTARHVIESNDPEQRVAEPGDVVTGKFVNGHFSFGKWVKASGGTETLMIGQ